MTEADDRDPREDECGSRRTVQLGRMAATDLKCVLQRWEHRDDMHSVGRRFGDVVMTARWPGSFEEPAE